MAKVGCHGMSRGAGNPQQVEDIKTTGDEAVNDKIPGVETLYGSGAVLA